MARVDTVPDWISFQLVNTRSAWVRMAHLSSTTASLVRCSNESADELLEDDDDDGSSSGSSAGAAEAGDGARGYEGGPESRRAFFRLAAGCVGRG